MENDVDVTQFVTDDLDLNIHLSSKQFDEYDKNKYIKSDTSQRCH